MDSIFEVNSTDKNFVTTNGSQINIKINSEINKYISNEDINETINQKVQDNYNNIVTNENENIDSYDNLSNNNLIKSDNFLLDNYNLNKNYDANKTQLNIKSQNNNLNSDSLNKLDNLTQSIKCTVSNINNINKFSKSSRGGYSIINLNDNKSHIVNKNNLTNENTYNNNKLILKKSNENDYLNENKSILLNENNWNNFSNKLNNNNLIRFSKSSRGGFSNINNNKIFHSFNQNNFTNENNFTKSFNFIKEINENNNNNGLRFSKSSRGGYLNKNFNNNNFELFNKNNFLNEFNNNNNNNTKFHLNKTFKENKNDNEFKLNRSNKSFNINFENKNINEFNLNLCKESYISYVPRVRNINEIFNEDIENANNYREIINDDEDIVISGKQIDIAILDGWSDGNFEQQLLKNIEYSNYIRPRKIQSYCIPLIQNGHDIKGHAETGSGKTAAFMIPLIDILMKTERIREPLSNPSPYVIIIEPTRELCLQVYDQGRKFANETNIIVTKTYGQYTKGINYRELQFGCDILCATPGRLLDLINNKNICLKNLKHIVFDEADYLLEINFIKVIREIVTFSEFPSKDKRQTLLFSATFPDEIQKLANDLLKSDYIMLSTKNKTLVSANERISQKFISVNANEKKFVLLNILKNCYNNTELQLEPKSQRTLVFVKTKRDADLLALWLNQENIKATTINGDRTQEQRELALNYFRNQKVFVLVATDICARGIDIKDLDHVINFDLPDHPVIYVHRIGRTGRLRKGYSTSFFDKSTDMKIAFDLFKILIEAGQEVPNFLKCIVNKTNSYDDDYVSEKISLNLNNNNNISTTINDYKTNKEKNLIKLNECIINDNNCNLLTNNNNNFTKSLNNYENVIKSTLNQSAIETNFKDLMLDEKQINWWIQSDDESN